MVFAFAFAGVGQYQPSAGALAPAGLLELVRHVHASAEGQHSGQPVWLPAMLQLCGLVAARDHTGGRAGQFLGGVGQVVLLVAVDLGEVDVGEVGAPAARIPLW